MSPVCEVPPLRCKSANETKTTPYWCLQFARSLPEDASQPIKPRALLANIPSLQGPSGRANQTETPPYPSWQLYFARSLSMLRNQPNGRSQAMQNNQLDYWSHSVTERFPPHSTNTAKHWPCFHRTWSLHCLADSFMTTPQKTKTLLNKWNPFQRQSNSPSSSCSVFP